MIHFNKLSETDASSVFEIYRSHPQYFEYAHNNHLSIDDVLNDMKATPPNIQEHQKQYLGIYQNNELMGIVDLILDYPREEEAYLGLFMIAAEKAGQGFGKRALATLEQELTSIQSISLGVIQKNTPALKFWAACGFNETDTKEIKLNGVSTSIIIMKK